MRDVGVREVGNGRCDALLNVITPSDWCCVDVDDPSMSEEVRGGPLVLLGVVVLGNGVGVSALFTGVEDAVGVREEGSTDWFIPCCAIETERER